MYYCRVRFTIKLLCSASIPIFRRLYNKMFFCLHTKLSNYTHSVVVRRRNRYLRCPVFFLRPGHPALGGCPVVALVGMLVLVTQRRRRRRLSGVREPQVRFAGVHVVPHAIPSAVALRVSLHFVPMLELKRK